MCRRADKWWIKVLKCAEVKLFSLIQQLEYAEEYAALKVGHKVACSSSIVRLGPFNGNGGLLWASGCLQYSELTYDEKHPIILPKGHLWLLLVWYPHALLKYAGVETVIIFLRGRLWIVGLRHLTKREKRVCHMSEARCTALFWTYGTSSWSSCQAESSFWSDRYGSSRSFILLWSPRKFYILLFTWAVTRAVHLEMVDSLSVGGTVFAIQWFGARSFPSVFYSDNTKAFHSVESLLVIYFGGQSSSWRFIAPTSHSGEDGQNV